MIWEQAPDVRSLLIEWTRSLTCAFSDILCSHMTLRNGSVIILFASTKDKQPLLLISRLCTATNVCRQALLSTLSGLDHTDALDLKRKQMKNMYYLLQPWHSRRGKDTPQQNDSSFLVDASLKTSSVLDSTFATIHASRKTNATVRQ